MQEFRNLPNASIEQIDSFPETSGVYIVATNSEVLYVGKTEDGFRSRWLNHHKLGDIPKEASVFFIESKKTGRQLSALEKEVVEVLAPLLNVAPVPITAKPKRSRVAKFGIQVTQWHNTFLQMEGFVRGFPRAAMASLFIQKEIDENKEAITKALEDIAERMGVTREELERAILSE